MAERFSDSDYVCIEALDSDDGREYMASGKDTISILLYGKLGTGKSSLINGLLGQKVAKEGNTSTSVTSAVKSYERTTLNKQTNKTVRLIIWDSPGRGDAFRLEDDRNQLTPEHIKNMDLVLYCFDMRRRFEESDLNEMQRFARLAGSDIWKHTAFVLTFANMVFPMDDEDNVQNYYGESFNSWMSTIKVVMTTKLNIPEEIVEGIPIVPTGYGNNSPPDRDDWFTPFWTAVLERMKPDAQPTMLTMSAHRIDTLTTFSEHAKDPEDKKIYANKKFPTYRVSLGMAATVGISTLTGAVIGTGVGIVGGPVGMGVGLVVGSAVGFLGSVGTITTGATISNLIKKHKEKKNKKD